MPHSSKAHTFEFCKKPCTLVGCHYMCSLRLSKMRCYSNKALLLNQGLHLHKSLLQMIITSIVYACQTLQHALKWQRLSKHTTRLSNVIAASGCRKALQLYASLTILQILNDKGEASKVVSNLRYKNNKVFGKIYEFAEANSFELLVKTNSSQSCW